MAPSSAASNASYHLAAWLDPAVLDRKCAAGWSQGVGTADFPYALPVVQLTGILAIGCMSLAMLLALRPRWLEGWLGGLDKMYRLHKWLGIGALVLSVLHWLVTKGPVGRLG